jgi:hypothetical protein
MGAGHAPVRAGIDMNKKALFILLALAVAVAGPAVNQVILAYHAPDESVADHFFTTPEITNLAGDSVFLALAIIFLTLALWYSLTCRANPVRELFCGWYNSAYLESNRSVFSGITTPRYLKGLGLFFIIRRCWYE